MAGAFEEVARIVADGILVQKIKSKNTGLTIIKADVEGVFASAEGKNVAHVRVQDQWFKDTLHWLLKHMMMMDAHTYVSFYLFYFCIYFPQEFLK